MQKITTATIFLTQNCNFQCLHCLNRCPYGKEMPFEDYTNLILILKRYGLIRIVFTGGEPTLHQKFEHIVEFTAKEEIDFSLISNGFLYKSYGPILLKYKSHLGKISFSIEGLKRTHDRNRKQGSFERVVEALNSRTFS